MAFAYCVNVYVECAHEQHVRRTLTLTLALTLTHTITAYLVSGNVVRVRILIRATRQKPCRKRVYPQIHVYVSPWQYIRQLLHLVSKQAKKFK